MGTLGGGNHFIEIDVDDETNKYLVIHTGSRNLGKQVAEYYQDLAIELCSDKEEMFKKKEKIIKEYKEQGRKLEIQQALKKLEKQYKDNKPNLPKELCYLEGKYREDYLHDMKICQEYARDNRLCIAKEILCNYFELPYYQGCKSVRLRPLPTANAWYTQDIVEKDFYYFETIHNYISFEDNIVRKGAIRADKGERVLIPMNMRDGSIIAIGKGNEDWNNSAPHGAGRIMSRAKAKETFCIEEFKESMKDIYTTSVVEETIDEAPFVYKPMQEIINNIQETIDNEAKESSKLSDEILEKLLEKNDIKVVARALLSLITDKQQKNEEENFEFKPGEEVKLFLNVGKKDKIMVKDIVGSISANTAVSGNDIGKINILDKFSFIEVPGEYANEILTSMKDKQIKGRDVRIEVANG